MFVSENPVRVEGDYVKGGNTPKVNVGASFPVPVGEFRITLMRRPDSSRRKMQNHNPQSWSLIGKNQ
jgi:hypothetical protein